MTNKKTYQISLDVSSLISNYRKALEVMNNEGASSKTLAPLEKKLASIEAEFKRLQTIGNQGILNDPTGLKRYETEVQNAYRKLERLGDSFAIVTADAKKFTQSTSLIEAALKEVEKEAEKLQAKFSKTLQGLGFDKESAKSLSKQVDTEEKLVQVLKEEKKVRTENVKLAAQAVKQNESTYRQKAAKQLGESFFRAQSGSAGSLSPEAQTALNAVVEQRVQQALNKVGHKKLDNATAALQTFNATHKNTLTDAESAQQQKLITAEKKAQADYQSRLAVAEEKARQTTANVKTILQEMNDQLVKATMQSGSFNQIWNRMRAIVQQTLGITNENQIFGNTDVAHGAIKRIIDTQEKYRSQSDEGKALTNAQKQQNLLTDENIQRTKIALQEYIKSIQEVVQKENELNKAKEEDAQRTQKLSEATNKLSVNARLSAAASRYQTQELIKTAKEARQTSETFEQLRSHILMYFSTYSIINLFRRQLQEATNDIKTLDKSFATIAMVTSKSVGGMWEEYSNYAQIAETLGQTTNSVIDASALFYQQGIVSAKLKY